MFDWDIEKAILNFEKHGVAFEEASTAFDDENGLDWADLKHSKGRKSAKTFGRVEYSPASFHCLHDKETDQWQRNHPHHQRESGIV